MIPKILIIAGPTASGKKAFAMRAAERFQGEIVSADSRKVYRRLDIGTAKPSRSDRERIPHHLIDIIEPDAQFNAGEWVLRASDAVRDILGRRKLPILSGGTGFYIGAFTEGLSKGIEPDPGIRVELERVLSRHGPAHLYGMLEKADPVRAAELHENDAFRVIRALEIHRATGMSIEEIRKRERLTGGEYAYYRVGIDMARQLLYRRIDERVDLMVKAGLVEEVRSLLGRGYRRDLVCLDTVGYKEWFPYLDGAESFDSCLERVKRDTRRYAKRQVTWFRKRPGYRWVDASDRDTVEWELARIGEWLARMEETS